MSPQQALLTVPDQLQASAAKAAVGLEKPLLNQGQFQSIDTALRSIFPTEKEETKVQKARAVLQEVVADLSDQEVEIFLTELQCLLDSWLDVFEKQAFEGLTLREVLHGGQ